MGDSAMPLYLCKMPFDGFALFKVRTHHKLRITLSYESVY